MDKVKEIKKHLQENGYVEINDILWLIEQVEKKAKPAKRKVVKKEKVDGKA
jgi:hypothetical protein